MIRVRGHSCNLWALGTSCIKVKGRKKIFGLKSPLRRDLTDEDETSCSKALRALTGKTLSPLEVRPPYPNDTLHLWLSWGQTQTFFRVHSWSYVYPPYFSSYSLTFNKLVGNQPEVRHKRLLTFPFENKVIKPFYCHSVAWASALVQVNSYCINKHCHRKYKGAHLECICRQVWKGYKATWGALWEFGQTKGPLCQHLPFLVLSLARNNTI